MEVVCVVCANLWESVEDESVRPHATGTKYTQPSIAHQKEGGSF